LFPNSTAPTGSAAPVPKTPAILRIPIPLVSAIDNSLAALCIVLKPVLIISAGKATKVPKGSFRRDLIASPT